MKQRIEDCEQAAALAGRGALTLPRRELILNVKKMLSRKKTLPRELRMELCVRYIHDLWKQLVGDIAKDGDDTEDDILEKLLDALTVWRAFIPGETVDSFDPLTPSFASLAASLCDEMQALMNEGDEDEKPSSEDIWKAGSGVCLQS